MHAIDAALPATDGVAWFNRMYLLVTERVVATIDEGFFNDVAFMRRLDVVFANLYFRALAASVTRPDQTPRAWVPLFDARSMRTIAPIQFALAGMNAHINRDLPVALAETCKRMNVSLNPDRFADYLRTNQILEEAQEEVKRWFATGWLDVLDQAFDRVDDVISIWSISRARDAAWVNGETLVHLRILPHLSAAFVATLDRTVGFAGRGLLVPVV